MLSKKNKRPSALKKLRRLGNVTKKQSTKASSEAKRGLIAKETEAFLKAGHEIKNIPYGVSGLDPMARGKPVTHGQT